ncbi:MAG: SDR family oxidoreductase [Erythrobacter sp.]|nr:SDR family oxidoreductase [Erythrobacter sp.]
MPDLNRRALLAGAAATGVLAATASFAQADMIGTIPDLSGKSVLVTGCSSGFGRLGAEHYARLGAKVFATMRNLPRPEADELRMLALNEKLDLQVIEIDVTSDEQVENGVNEALMAAGGSLDVIVNNAGIGLTGPIEVQDMEATRLMFDTNVYGPHRVVRAALPAMRKRGSGLIIPISSQLGKVIVPFSGQYSPTKFALEAMNQALAYELVQHGIDVSIVQPGGYPTEIWRNRNALTAALKERAEAEHLTGYPQVVERMGQEDGSSRSADPMDVPRAIASLIAMPAGARPIRVPVHPGRKPQIPINEAIDAAQLDWLGAGRLGPVMQAVHGA